MFLAGNNFLQIVEKITKIKTCKKCHSIRYSLFIILKPHFCVILVWMCNLRMTDNIQWNGCPCDNWLACCEFWPCGFRNRDTCNIPLHWNRQNLDAPFPHRPCTVFSSLSSIKTYCSTVALQHPCKGENTQSICSPMAYCRLATTMYKYSSHHFLI